MATMGRLTDEIADRTAQEALHMHHFDDVHIFGMHSASYERFRAGQRTGTCRNLQYLRDAIGGAKTAEITIDEKISLWIAAKSPFRQSNGIRTRCE